MLGLSWRLLGPSLGPLGPSWAVGKPKKKKQLKCVKNLREINDLSLLEPSWEEPWGSLGTSWRLLGPSWTSWADRLAIRGFSDIFGSLSGLSWGRQAIMQGAAGYYADILGSLGIVLGASWAVLEPS